MQELKTLSVKIPVSIDAMFAGVCYRAGVTRYQMLKNFVAYVIRAASDARDLTADGERILQDMCTTVHGEDFAIVKRGEEVVLYTCGKECRRTDDIVEALLGCIMPRELSMLRSAKSALRAETLAEVIDACAACALRAYGTGIDADVRELFADNDRDDFGRKLPEHRPRQTKTKRQ